MAIILKAKTRKRERLKPGRKLGWGFQFCARTKGVEAPLGETCNNSVVEPSQAHTYSTELFACLCQTVSRAIRPDFQLESSLNFCYDLGMNIGQRLCELRAAKGLSQGDIEEKSGLMRCYTSRVENEYTVPNLETLEKFAKAMEIELYQLFFEGGGKPIAVQTKKPPELSFAERGLVDTFRKLGNREKVMAVEIIERLKKPVRKAGRVT